MSDSRLLPPDSIVGRKENRMGRYLRGSLAVSALGIATLVIATVAPQGEGAHALVVAGSGLTSTGALFIFLTLMFGWDDQS